MITGSAYLLRGQRVTVLAAWNGARRDLPAPLPLVRLKATGPRNVLIRWPDGREEVRGFRGLRVPPEPVHVAGGAL